MKPQRQAQEVDSPRPTAMGDFGVRPMLVELGLIVDGRSSTLLGHGASPESVLGLLVSEPSATLCWIRGRRRSAILPAACATAR